MNKLQAMIEHIQAREEFFAMKFTKLQKAYGMFRMMFISKTDILAATMGLHSRMARRQSQEQ